MSLVHVDLSGHKMNWIRYGCVVDSFPKRKKEEKSKRQTEKEKKLQQKQHCMHGSFSVKQQNVFLFQKNF